MKDISTLREDFKDIGKSSNRVKKLFKRIDKKLKALKKDIKKYSYKY